MATATAPGPPVASKALEELCQDYWAPLYAFLRRRGAQPQDAQDLVQGFFVQLLEKGGLSRADPMRGRFRTYLLAALKHFAANEWAREGAKKRGGHPVHLRLDRADEEEGRLQVADPAESAERAFERRYAEAVVGRALDRLAQAECAVSSERADRFQVLRPLLWGEGPPQQEAAEALDMSPTALKVALHRLRARLGQALRCEVGETLRDPADTDEEIRSLIAALRRA